MPELSVLALRAFGAIAMLFVLTRILGKKQISQLTFFEYITGITLGEVAGFMSTDLEENYVHGIAVLIVWFAVPLGLEYLTLKSKRLRDLFEGKGTVVIEKGKVMEENLKKERFTADELLEQLRTKNVFRVADVEFAMLEPSGDLSVLLKPEHQPLTPQHIGLQVGKESEPQTVVLDGSIMDEPLSNAGLNRGWLKTELDKLGVPVENIFIAQVDSYGQLYLDLFDDRLQTPTTSVRATLLATLKKCEADLELFGLSTGSPETKRMYESCSKRLKTVVESLTPVLKR